MTKIKPVILCGGSGTRLWPLSVPSRPKQFQNLLSGRSMLAETAARLREGSDGISFDAPQVIGAARHAAMIEEAVPDATRILEPFGRDSAPAIAAVALANAPDSYLLILPADHHIKDLSAFKKAIAAGVPQAQAGRFVTFGINPTEPSSAYGYIKSQDSGGAAMLVERFVEKPDRTTAEQYLAEGNYYWNAGIFLFRAKTFTDYAQQKIPDIMTAVAAALGTAKEDSITLNAAAFSKSPAISVDYAIMEPASADNAVAVVPVDMGWSDVGDHTSVYLANSEDGSGVNLKGPVTADRGPRLSVHSTGPTVAAIGVDNVAIVATRDSVLVSDLDRTQDVKAIAQACNGFARGFLLPEGTKTRIRNWLFEKALPQWAEHAWSAKFGGFKESLDFNDLSEKAEFRRSRVQMRQIYAFSHAHVLGWEGPAEDLVKRGIDYLYTTCWRSDRGFLHHITLDGEPLDQRMDTYDHAFALLAMAWSYRAGFAPDAAERIDAIVDLLDSRLRQDGGGFVDDDTGRSGLRANPHMHLLEAFLALFEAFGNHHWLDRAGECVRLFESQFFDPYHDCVLEHFGEGWLLDGEKGDRIEPGHAYEWAALLNKYELYTGHDCASWRRRLIASADRLGRDAKTGFALNAITRRGEPVDAGRRLWPQTEMFRAKITDPGANGIQEADELVAKLFETYLKDAPDGFLMDSYAADGQPTAKVIPGSMLYHMVSAFAPVIDNSKA